MAGDIQRRLAAILAADVVEYSRLMGADEARTLADLRQVRNDLFEPRVADHNGNIVKRLGDGWLVEFPSVADAVACAVAIQDGLTSHERIKLRIGVHIGDVTFEAEDIYGDGVNVAARLEDLAHPGEVTISDTAHNSLDGSTSARFSGGESLTLKNIARPVQVFRYATTGVPPQPPRPLRRRAPLLIAVAGALLVAVLLGAWQLWPRLASMGGEVPPALENPRLSIAVLPFANLSRDADQDYFADALTEDLTADLSRISGSFVISRSTAATYRGQSLDAKQVARELNVRYLLEGNVRKAAADVLVKVALTDGETGQQVWSERYRKTAGDMYAFQNEVTGRVARTLNLELKDALSRQAARGPVENLDAADLALRGWAELWTKPQKPATNSAALAYVGRALELEPNNGEAHGVAAYAYARAANYRWGMTRAEALERGLAAGERALTLDPKNVDALYALAFLHYIKGDSEGSLEMLRQCMALNRNHAPAYFFYGVNLVRLGRPREAIAWIERAFKLSPRDPLRSVWYGVIARAHIAGGEDRRAIEVANKGIAANSNHPHNHAALAAAQAHLGRMAEAEAALRNFVKVQPGMTLRRYQGVVAADNPVAIRTNQRLMDGLRKAGLPE